MFEVLLSILLSFSQPTERVDGSAIQSGQIASYEVCTNVVNDRNNKNCTYVDSSSVVQLNTVSTITADVNTTCDKDIEVSLSVVDTTGLRSIPVYSTLGQVDCPSYLQYPPSSVNVINVQQN